MNRKTDVNDKTIKDINICRQIIFMGVDTKDSRLVVQDHGGKRCRSNIIMSLPHDQAL